MSTITNIFKKPSKELFKPSEILMLAIYLLSIIIVYFCLHGIYRPNNMDDAWYLSFARHHITQGIESDITFGTDPAGGAPCGVMLFGKSYSYLYGMILNITGWTKSNGHLISTFLMLLCAGCWMAILRRLGFSRYLTVLFGFALLLVEPFFGAANQARPDALVLLMVSIALLLFLHRRYLLAGFSAAMAIEIHPAGICALLLMTGVVYGEWMGNRREMRRLGPMIVGLAAGFCAGAVYYFALHGQHLNLLPSVLSQGNNGASRINNILFEYFFKTKYLRHLPELLVITACAGWFFYKRYARENLYISAFLVASLLFTLIIRRPNFMYAVYVYPAFLLLILWVFEREGKLNPAAVLLLFYLLPQYGLVYLQNRHWDMEAYLANVRALTPEGETVIGRPNDWFAFYDRTFYVDDYLGDLLKILPEHFVLIEGEAFRNGAYPKLKDITDHRYKSSEYGEFQSLGEKVVVKAMTRKAALNPSIIKSSS